MDPQSNLSPETALIPRNALRRPMKPLTGILETALYVSDLPRAVRFYTELFELRTLRGDDRFHAFSVADRQVLLLFLRGGSTSTTHVEGGAIPPHDGSGPLHFAFSIPTGSEVDWERRLQEQGVALEGRVDWPSGGVSLYFRDPDQHLVELLTPGVWAIY